MKYPQQLQRLSNVTTFFVITFASILCSGDDNKANTSSEAAFFEKKIRPMLVKHCYECHSTASAELKGELSLDSRDGIRTGGESGPSVVPGNIDESLLIDALRYESFEMPPKKKLPEAVIRDFVRWIELGAIDPRDEPPFHSARRRPQGRWRRAAPAGE